MINRVQCTIVCHVDDINASCVDPEVLIALIRSMQQQYGKHAPLTMTCGKVRKYLGMTIDLSRKCKVIISMIKYILKIFSLLPEKMQQDILKGKTTTAS